MATLSKHSSTPCGPASAGWPGQQGPGPGVDWDICVIDKYPLGVAVVIGQ